MKKLTFTLAMLFCCLNYANAQSYDVYQNNEYGFQQKTGEIRESYNGNYDIYQNNQYGFLQRTGSYQQQNNNNNNLNGCQNNPYRLPQRTFIVVQPINGFINNNIWLDAEILDLIYDIY